MAVNQKVAIVTGSSSGIGLDTSVTLAQNRFLTYATMRNLDKSSIVKAAAEKEKLPIKVEQLDVTDDQSVSNAGYGLIGAFEDLSIDEIKNLYETNVFGLIRVTPSSSSRNEKTKIRYY